jgi:hypothetical protein
MENVKSTRKLNFSNGSSSGSGGEFVLRHSSKDSDIDWSGDEHFSHVRDEEKCGRSYMEVLEVV